MSRSEKQAFFLDLLSSQVADLGYKQTKKSFFKKKIFGEASFCVKISFFGDSVTHACPIFGIDFPSIEDELSRILLSSNNFTFTKSSMPTLFNEFSNFPKYINTEEFPPDFIIGANLTNDVDHISKFLSKLEDYFNSIDSVCKFAGDATSGLPIGHHAFRIPLLIRKYGNNCSLQNYIKYVSSLNFVQNYSTFIKEAGF